MKPFSMTGKNVLITGASSGFGHHFAGVLAESGARVVLGARRTEKIEARVKEINAAGGKAWGFELDVREPESVNSFMAAAEDVGGPIDVIVNNAGVESGAKTYAMIDEDDWDYVMDTNLKSVWRISKMYTERMIANGQSEGNIVLIASISAASAQAIDQANDLSRISLAMCVRRDSLSAFESANPVIGIDASKITAAATTGPASGPRPTSSTPATR